MWSDVVPNGTLSSALVPALPAIRAGNVAEVTCRGPGSGSHLETGAVPGIKVMNAIGKCEMDSLLPSFLPKNGGEGTEDSFSTAQSLLLSWGRLSRNTSLGSLQSLLAWGLYSGATKIIQQSDLH